ncbi:MAG TPA: NAD(P)H-hydrate dehydratase [Lentimicrobium sp.]|nr:NAD(P)H-hydrate dehydratase [Lentimicrobium sp.]
MSPIKILPVETIRDLDSYTIAKEPVRSIDLMERAAHKCYEWIVKRITGIRTFRIICGMGNNGGDGLAIARKLNKDGHNVEVYYIRHSSEASEDNRKNFEKISDVAGLVVTEIFEEDPTIEIDDDDIVIDALLGSGLNKPVKGFLTEIIRQINESNAYIISIDMPSGLMADELIADPAKYSIVNADYTLTFQMPKLAFFLPENERFVGEWKALDIGLHKDFIKGAKSHFHYTRKKDCIELYKSRNKFAHKGNFGHGLLIAGSLGKMGAAILAAKAALRAGAGLITAHIPLTGIEPMLMTIPEAMVSPDDSETHFTILPDLNPYNAIAIGPGLGTHIESQNAMKFLIQEVRKPLIIDADGLNILAENKTWLSFLPPDSILTPHPKEFERLTSKVDNHLNRLEILRAFSVRFKVNVILKGAYSAVSTPEGDVFFNPTGNPGMATGGTGDVLTGILLGLRASGYSPKETCILGTWLHGKAGDIAAGKLSQPALIASDITENLGKAFLKLIK